MFKKLKYYFYALLLTAVTLGEVADGGIVFDWWRQ